MNLKLCVTLLLGVGLLAFAQPTVSSAASSSMPPGNDDFDGATVIAALPFVDHVDMSDATTAFDDPYACYGGFPSVWYSFTPSQNMVVKVSTAGSDFQAHVSVLTGSRGALTTVACPGNGSTFSVVSGTTYYFMVVPDFYSGSIRNLVFTLDGASAPPNDDIDNATVITSLPFSNSENTLGATPAPDDPGFCNSGPTVWYAFTPTQDMYLRANTASSDYFPYVGVFTGSRGALTAVACNYPEVTFTALAGTKYYFMVAGGGNLVFTLDGNPSLKVSVIIDASDNVDQKAGVATLSGTVNCSRPATINISGDLRQPVGRVNIIQGGYGLSNLSCSGATRWSATIVPTNGKFAGGKATATATVGASDVATGEFVVVATTASVTLKSK